MKDLVHVRLGLVVMVQRDLQVREVRAGRHLAHGRPWKGPCRVSVRGLDGSQTIKDSGVNEQNLRC